MHIRDILIQYGLRYTKAHDTVEILYMAIYIFGRVIMGTYTAWSATQCQHNVLLIKLAALGLLIQALFFIKHKFSILTMRFKEMSDRKSFRIRSRWFDPLTRHELEKLGIAEKKEVQVRGWVDPPQSMP